MHAKGYKVTKTNRNNPTETIAPKSNILPEGYIAIVTGGAAGIGEHIARSYVQAKAAGVVITGRRNGPLDDTKGKLEKLAEELGHKVKVTTFSGDAEKSETYAELKEHVEKEHGGRLDALICNAGPGDAGPTHTWTPKIQDQDVKSWDSVVGVNLNGPYYAAKHLLPLLLRSEGKTIVNVVSAAAHMTAGFPPISYCVGKFGETRLTQNIGEVYAAEGLQAFALHPGAVKTPSSSTMPEEMQAILVDDINLCGNICVWLSKQRPQWLSGRYLSVNWDVDELAARKDEVVEKDLFKFKMAV